MVRLNCILPLTILFHTCLFQSQIIIAKIIYVDEFDSPPLPADTILDEYMTRSCANVFRQIEKERKKNGLYLKVVKANMEQKVTHASHIFHETTLPTNHEDALQCFQKYYHLYHYLRIHGCTSHDAMLFLPNNFPRRSLAHKLQKVFGLSSDSTSDDSIIIPPELLFQPPQRQPDAYKNTSSSISKEEHNKNLNIVIVIAASIAGISTVLALMIFCSLIRSCKGSGDKQRDDDPHLTLSSSDHSVDSSDINDIRRNMSTCHSNIESNGRHGSSLPRILENELLDGTRKAETLNSQKKASEQSSVSSPPAPPPAPTFKPKAPPPPHKCVQPPLAPPLRKGHHQRGRSTSGEENDISGEPNAPRTKLKPFFWDKVVGSPDHSMVWDEIRAGSFQFSEQKIESLFGYNLDNKRNGERGGPSSHTSQPQQIQIIDPKKSQNLSILLKALNVTTEEVCDALLEGNELPTELLQTLLRMAPTQEEELKLRLFDGDLSFLGPAEKFLKVVVDIPLAFKRMESIMFMMTYKEEVSCIKESFITLEVACDELKKSRLFLKLLEAVLKTGNRMNDGTYRGGAQAFKLDTLLKLADVKGTDGKTTLLHFVVQEIIKAEGLKATRTLKDNGRISSGKADDFVDSLDPNGTEQYETIGLEIVSRLSSELENVKRAAIIDADGLTITVSKLGQSLRKLKNFSNKEMENTEEKTGFYLMLVCFRDHSEGEVEWLVKEEQRISELVTKTADYFHGNAGREEGLRLFSVVRDFLIMLDKICAQLQQSISSNSKGGIVNNDKNTSQKRSSQDTQQSIQDMRRQFLPMITGRHADDYRFSSDSE